MSKNNENTWEDIYMASRNLNTNHSSSLILEAAMGWIEHMDSKEFQERLLEGTLPEFIRDKPPVAKCPIERMTNHAYLLMTEECHRVGLYNQGYLHRLELRYIDVEHFKLKYYNEFKKIDYDDDYDIYTA